MKITILLNGALILEALFGFESFAQPKPGDVFREYAWAPTMAIAEHGKFLRVGGKRDYRIYPAHYPSARHENGNILFEDYINLESAIRAEMVLEKILSHDDTKGLDISINKNLPIPVPQADAIPVPESDYMHHTFPIVNVPLEQLNEGWDNTFQLSVDTVQRWGWPQNLINGVILRVYYNPEIVKVKPEISGISSGAKLGTSVKVGITNSQQSIKNVDYIGFYEGLNYEGDGNYQQWHYNYLRGRLINNIGSTFNFPYSVEWITEWVPDQNQGIRIAARIVYNTNLIYFTEVIEGLTLDRNFKVELCKPYDQPINWVTRVGELESKVDISGESQNIQKALMCWTSWSPCYSNGIYINDVKVFENEGPCYDYMAHQVEVDNLKILKHGSNIIKTGQTPLHDGKKVHGMEVQWPGIMLLIKYVE